MTRVLSLFVVAMLGVPAVAPLACDWLCGATHAAAAAGATPTESCHDHGQSPASGPALTGAHSCHELAVVPASVLRDAGQPVLPAVANVTDVRSEDRRPVAIHAPTARLTAHAPPPLALPLRI